LSDIKPDSVAADEILYLIQAAKAAIMAPVGLARALSLDAASSD